MNQNATSMPWRSAAIMLRRIVRQSSNAGSQSCSACTGTAESIVTATAVAKHLLSTRMLHPFQHARNLPRTRLDLSGAFEGAINVPAGPAQEMPR